jgi:ABC-type nitrate/sulfonate/bicarbonate transport system substrate-binding protein
MNVDKNFSRLHTRMRFVAGMLCASVALSVSVVAASAAAATAPTNEVCKPSFPLTKITVMYQPSGASSYFYANATHLWSKFGLKLKQIKVEAGQSELAALASGSVDFAFLGGPPTLTSIGRKLPVKIVFSTNNVSHLEGLIVLPASGIKNLSDLQGKTVASPEGSSAWVGMHLTLKKAGVPIDKVKILNLSPAAILSSFSNKTVTAAWIWDTWIKRLETIGGKVVALEHNYGVAEPNTWVVSDKFLKSNPEAVARFDAVLNLGAEGANKNPSAAAPEFASLTGITQTQAIAVMKAEPTFTISTGLSSDSPLSFVNTNTGLAATLARSGAVLRKYDILPNAPTESQIANVIDVQSLRSAKKLLEKRCSHAVSAQ